MKRLILSLAVTALALLGVSQAAPACTSFAVGGPRPIFGMNFDYARFPMKLLLEDNGNLRTFHLAFERVIQGEHIFVTTGGMNSNGLFYACQELHPQVRTPPPPREGDMPLYLLNTMVGRMKTVAELKAVCAKAHLTQVPDVTCHTLFADKTGAALVVETGTGRNLLTPMTGPYLAMANFASHGMKGKPYQDARGCGDDRYKVLCAYLEKTRVPFDVDHGLSALEQAYNRNPAYPTSCSMVFDPQAAEVFLAFHRNFSKVWKVSLKTGTVETFRGFDTATKHQLGKNGILVSELLDAEATAAPPQQ
ncbi:hypothetical protein [Desulfoluna spongiiphila]|uniref:Choloylglycine hydrolase n=1 Tax=Desulfoluna spongiiphila TaxID=419481 RepID=A0A1G5F5S1_9BACT|nr:hypothetical protein [Desulfoluna spongiiphila]SCY34250.1 hypothetical protein SAMN05216233_107141 [Desulfoluna spongiiphila]